jgi:tetratricopeptide (TPR) repeat protein
MSNRPDFIVDPSGNVQDVRTQKHPPESAAPHSQRSDTRYTQSSASVPLHVQPTSQPRQSPTFIVIPIGLIITIIVALCRLFNPSATGPHYSSSDVSSLNTGITSYDAGNYDRAITYFDMVIWSEPDLGEAYNNRGLAYHAKGNDERALADFDKSIRLMPKSATPYSNRGAVYISKEEYNTALVDLNKAIEIQPGFSKAYYNRALAYLGLGQTDNAIADFDKAIEFTPERSTTYYRQPTRGNTFGSDFATHLQNTQSYANLPMAYALRGSVYLNELDYDQALDDFNKAIELQPDLALAYYYRGIAYTLTGDYDKAQADMNQALELDNDPATQQKVKAFKQTQNLQ